MLAHAANRAGGYSQGDHSRKKTTNPQLKETEDTCAAAANEFISAASSDSSSDKGDPTSFFRQIGHGVMIRIVQRVAKTRHSGRRKQLTIPAGFGTTDEEDTLLPNSAMQ